MYRLRESVEVSGGGTRTQARRRSTAERSKTREGQNERFDQGRGRRGKNAEWPRAHERRRSTARRAIQSARTPVLTFRRCGTFQQPKAARRSTLDVRAHARSHASGDRCVRTTSRMRLLRQSLGVRRNSSAGGRHCTYGRTHKHSAHRRKCALCSRGDCVRSELSHWGVHFSTRRGHGATVQDRHPWLGRRTPPGCHIVLLQKTLVSLSSLLCLRSSVL